MDPFRVRVEAGGCEMKRMRRMRPGQPPWKLAFAPPAGPLRWSWPGACISSTGSGGRWARPCSRTGRLHPHRIEAGTDFSGQAPGLSVPLPGHTCADANFAGADLAFDLTQASFFAADFRGARSQRCP